VDDVEVTNGVGGVTNSSEDTLKDAKHDGYCDYAEKKAAMAVVRVAPETRRASSIGLQVVLCYLIRDNDLTDSL
jgi:hypothetical protein